MIEQIVLGLTVTILGGAIFHVFRYKQLYVVLPKFFSVSHLSDEGRLVEVRVYNKGRTTEEDVSIRLDPSNQYDLVGSTCSSMSLDSETVLIPRVPPGEDFSALLLVENGELTKEKISSVSSKTSKGKVLSKVEDVPPNHGNTFLSILGIVALAVLPIYSYELYEDHQKEQALLSLSHLKESGWSSLEIYAESNLIEYYDDGEFPVYLGELYREGNRVLIPIRFINKTASEMKVDVIPNSPFTVKDPQVYKAIKSNNPSKIAPIGSEDMELSLYWPKDEKGDVVISFSLRTSADIFLRFVKTVNVNI